MAERRARYLEARIYMAWVALALLIASWAGIAIHDQAERRQAQIQNDSQTTVANSATSPQPRVHTRTRGS